MKKNLFLKIICVCILFSKIYGSEYLSETSMYCLSKNHPHHVYLGPEGFLFDLNTHIQSVKVSGTKGFLGIRAGYEYLKPKAFYAGIDLLSAISNKSFHATSQGNHFQHSGNTGFGNVEIRLGYTFANQDVMLTPFLGIGAYAFGNNSHYFHFNESMVYYTAGMRSLLELSHSFNLGLNWKIFRTTDTEQKFKYLFAGQTIKPTDHNNMWGGEIGVPLIWHLGCAKRWDIQLEPYFLKLTFSEPQNIYGTRLLFGYRI